jgi:hypothetical protein
MSLALVPFISYLQVCDDRIHAPSLVDHLHVCQRRYPTSARQGEDIWRLVNSSIGRESPTFSSKGDGWTQLITSLVRGGHILAHSGNDGMS